MVMYICASYSDFSSFGPLLIDGRSEGKSRDGVYSSEVATTRLFRPVFEPEPSDSRPTSVFYIVAILTVPSLDAWASPNTLGLWPWSGCGGRIDSKFTLT